MRAVSLVTLVVTAFMLVNQTQATSNPVSGFTSTINNGLNKINPFTKPALIYLPSLPNPFRSRAKSSGSKPSYKAKPSYKKGASNYRAPSSTSNTALQVPVSGYSGAVSSGSGITGSSNSRSQSKEELLTLVLQMHKLIHELLDENEAVGGGAESYGTPHGNPISGNVGNSVETYGTPRGKPIDGSTSSLSSYGSNNLGQYQAEALPTYNNRPYTPQTSNSVLPSSNSIATNSFSSQSSLSSYGSAGSSTLSEATSSYSGPNNLQPGQVLDTYSSQADDDYGSPSVQPLASYSSSSGASSSFDNSPLQSYNSPVLQTSSGYSGPVQQPSRI